MISVIAGALFFAALTYGGFLIRGQYALRYRIMREMCDFAAFFSREVSMYKTPVKTVVDKFLMFKEKGQSKILTAFQVMPGGADYQKLYKLSEYICLTAEDRRLITDFLVNLGRGDYMEERKAAEQYHKDLTLLRDGAENALRRDGKLYFRLLSLAGFALMIIVV